MAAKRAFSSDLLGLIMAFIILGMMGIVTVRTEQNRRASGAWVRHTLQVQTTLSRLQGAIYQAESNERGYLLTQNERYAQNYASLANRLENDLRGLQRLVADNPSQFEKAEKIRPILQERIALLSKKIEMTKEGRADEAIALVRAGGGQQLMDEIEKLISSMIAQEDKYYERQSLNLDAETESLKKAIIALAFIAVVVAGFALYLSHRQLRELTLSKDSLSLAYNALLDESKRREALESQLRQSQKLEAIGQLTGGVAHDFNNMLSVIVASLNILRRKLQRNETDYESVIQSALEGADKAAGLIRRLLAFARMQPLVPEAIDANKLVSGMSTLLQHTLGRGVTLETVFCADLWMTKIDANQLENAILNLAVNARDAMPDGGRLTLETANCFVDEESQKENPEAKPGQYVTISVTDTGTGMSPDVMAKAYDPFFTTKPVGKGSGLGLSQVHGFVKQSGGYIKIDSALGQGSAIKLYLPRYHGAGKSMRVTTPAQELPRGRAEETILVVDDDDSARKLTAESVRELGYTVLDASGGSEAIEIIRRRPDIALMITDVVMPEIDGARLAREATFRRHGLRVLFMTGFSRNAVFHNGVLDGHVHLMSKPFALDQLARTVRSLLDAPVHHG